MGSAEGVQALLKERPDLEPALEAVLRPKSPFTFDDVEVDSGEFGELVARGVVEKAENGYRVANPGAVRRGLSGEPIDERGGRLASLSLPSLPVSRLELAYLGGAVALVVAFRLVPLPSVYHGGHIVLSSNDPYYYRYLVERLLTDPSTTPGNLGFGVSRGEPLLVTTLWLATRVLGGTVDTAGHVLAWYPVVSAAVTAVLVYALSVIVTDDRRIGLASVAMLAIVPAHGLRTSLGFADHEAFDYLWLTITLIGLVVIAREVHHNEPVFKTRTAASGAAVAIGVAGQTLAWDNSPILLGAIGGYLALEGLRTVRTETRPVRTIGLVVAGVGVGAGLVWLAHSRLGWHTTLVASAPMLLTLGGLGVLAGTEFVIRLNVGPLRERGSSTPSVVILAVLESAGFLVGALALRAIRPQFWSRLITSLNERLIAPRPIVEVMGLFSERQGWLLLLGFALFVGVPYLLWASSRVSTDGRWLPPVSYTWYFLALSIIQVRFVGTLALAFAVFTGLGLVHLAERIDVARRPAPFTNKGPLSLKKPTRQQFGAMALLFLLVGSAGIVQTYTLTNQVTPNPAQSDAAIWIAEYNETHDLSSNYVFSQWGQNRMFNYFVSGESRSYGYAQSYFQEFVSSTDPGAWYDRLGNRRGFVVTTPEVVGDPYQLGTRLHRYNGMGSVEVPALAHYRLVHVTGDGAYKVFTVVPGAVIRGTAEPNRRVTAQAEVQVDDRSFTYVRWTDANDTGVFRLRVSQPGEYRVEGAVVSVNETAVTQGITIRVE